MRSARLAGLVCLALLAVSPAGCSRSYWRRNADSEAYGLIREKTKLDARWAQPRSDVIPSPLSRNFDPADPDYGPLPPDDPAAHRYMRRMSDCNRIRGSHYWDEIGMGNTVENPAWVASLPPDAAPDALLSDAAEPPKPPSVIADLTENGITKPLRTILSRLDPETPGRASVATAEAAALKPVPKAPAAAESSPLAALPKPATKPESGILLTSFQEEEGANDAAPVEPPRADAPTEDEPLRPEPLLPAPFPPGEDGPDAIPSSDTPPSATLPELDDTLSDDPGNPATAATAPSEEVDFTAGNPTLPDVENLTLEEAVRLSYLHNREYQTQIEDVFLAALDLAFDRFQFDVRFLGIGGGRPSSDLLYTGVPEGQQSLAWNNRIGISRLLPAGGQWAVELANQTLWLFSDAPDESTTASTLSFSFIQPLLFAAGRKVVLEDLTQSERNLLYAARDLARFRQTFFVATVSGQNGYLGLIEQIQTIANQEDNLRRLEEQLEISRENVVLNADPLSVTSLESQFLQQVNNLRSSRVQLQDRLDGYKLQLGLPPDVKMSLDTKLLQPFRLISPELAELEEAIDDEYFAVAEGIQLANPQRLDLRRAITVLESLVTRIRDVAFPSVEEDFGRVDEALPRRLANVPDPKDRLRIEGDLLKDRQLFDQARTQFDELAARLEQISRRLESTDAPEGPAEFGELDMDSDGRLTRDEIQKAPADEFLRRMAGRFEELDRSGDGGIDRSEFAVGIRQEVYLEAQEIEESLERGVRGFQGIQAGLRTELIELNPFDLPLIEAVGYGLTNRVDLMNQRALVTDARRKVEVASNALRAVLDVRVEGDIRTRPLFQNDNPLDFRRQNSTYRVGVGFVAPLDQIAQRNAYRVSQISYQRARRSYIQAEDQVKQQVRQSWRQLELLKQNFEIARYAIRVAAKQYDQAVEQATGPQRGGGGGGGATGGGGSGGAGNQGTQLSNALNRLLQAQNQLIGIWVDYESARLNIYRDMGIMEIDARGLWCDPFYQNGLDWPEGAVGTLPGQGGATDGADGGSDGGLDEKVAPDMIPPAPTPTDGVETGGAGPAGPTPTSAASRPASPAGRGVRPAAHASPPVAPAPQVGHDRTRPPAVRNQPRPSDRAGSVPAGRDGAVSGGTGEKPKTWRRARPTAAAKPR